ncbi:MAG: exodeoxyribonuclease V subunit gamma [Lachnospiraceae bacterium]|nr:exodeoxyribonuclease V subunit gamma [Lachnospiraceae bacterium]
MSKLRLLTGPSGSGKSTSIYKEVLERAGREKDRNFFFIVPDQAAMSTQKALVGLSPDRGILNIDVLGFGRLSHRILEETGQEEIPVLDDTGMSLVIQKVASSAAGNLPVLGNRLDSAGMIAEVKSAISEFMQYGITPGNMDELTDCCLGRGALRGKLKDLSIIYSLFEEYIEGHYITREEKLDILCGAIPSSSLLPDSVIVLDGFTGFTPVQMRVIESLMGRCSEMIVTLECSEGEDVCTPAGEEELFFLSHKTACSLLKLAKEKGMEIPGPESCMRMLPDHDIALLEKNLFRKKRTPSAGDFSGSVHITEMTDPGKEVRYIGVKLRELLAKKAYQYRDIAVVCGNIEGYAPYFSSEFTRLGIPFFLDNVNGLSLDPLAETVQAYLDILSEDYAPGSVTRLLKAGLTGIDSEETDLLDNYIRQTGVRGFNAWHREFTKTVRSRSKDSEYLGRINSIRRKVVALFTVFEEDGKRVQGRGTAAGYTKRLYEALMNMDAPGKMRVLKRRFEEQGDAVRAGEYKSVWKQFVDLFDKIYLLLGDDEVSFDNFAGIVGAGIGEMRVPGIPVNVDRVLIGDIERSRLEGVKVLFFAGVNDGNIPADTSGKGMISDLDREFLYEQGIELSPTPRQKMYIQRQYLYMNICKPSDELYISYVRVRSDGKSVRPSYLIPVIKRILPYTSDVYRPEDRPVNERVSTGEDALSELSVMMREYADSQGASSDKASTFALYSAIGEMGGVRQKLTEAVYKRYLDNPLSKEAVNALYPRELKGSVSSLETYAGCPYRYFLRFGLNIDQGDSYEIQSFDRGLLVHDIIRRYTERLHKDGSDWKSFTDEYASHMIPELATEAASAYSGSLYYDNKRNEYNILRLSRLVINSACFLRDQLAAGDFDLAGSEKPFVMDLPLDGGRTLHMTGIVDRIDIAEGENGKYIQIMDFKSGGKDIDITKLMDGRQIQLPLYMYSEKEQMKAIPASLLYFQIQDPMYDLESIGDMEKADDELRRKMRPKGEMLEDAEALSLLDRSLKGLAPQSSSEYFYVGTRKDGAFTAASRVLSKSAMDMMLNEAVSVAKSEGKEILDGKISVSPYSGTCKYCPYKSACGLDRKIPGYKFRTDSKLKRADAIAALCAEQSGEGSGTKTEEGGEDNGL